MGGRNGPPPFQLGRVLPPFVHQQLGLSEDQEKALQELEKDVRQRLEHLLTADQKRQIAGIGLPGVDRRPRTDSLESFSPKRPQRNTEIVPEGLVKNPRFTLAGTDGKTPAHYLLNGAAKWQRTGKVEENADMGIAFLSGPGAGAPSGSVAQDVAGFPGGTHQWFRFSFRGLAESGFSLQGDELVMKVDFFAKQGTSPLDGVMRKLYGAILRDRRELAANGNRRRGGGAVWKTYALDFKLPFAEIDQLRLSVGFRDASATSARNSAFYVTELALEPIPEPTAVPKLAKHGETVEPAIAKLVPLGGRWYYDPENGNKEKPARLLVDYKNVHQLYYLDSRLTNPFAANMTAWLRKGYLDRNGELVQEERLCTDNVVIEFNDQRTLIVHARNLPNHPTAQFPELDGGNPSYIQEHEYTYYLPLNPERNPKARAMDIHNANRALPMGATGIAINGVVFYNPFDAGMQDATDMMDRCCGHPSPDNRYHYHKYPVCVKSPFIDEGLEHSPLIGWAFDGFPIYGPYEAKGLMAKDLHENPLNAFNAHYDSARGWHYHVTPGKFPYVIGGYFGKVDSRNFRRGP
jgi:hypothetical protein